MKIVDVAKLMAILQNDIKHEQNGGVAHATVRTSKK